MYVNMSWTENSLSSEMMVFIYLAVYMGKNKQQSIIQLYLIV